MTLSPHGRRLGRTALRPRALGTTMERLGTDFGGTCKFEDKGNYKNGWQCLKASTGECAPAYCSLMVKAKDGTLTPAASEIGEGGEIGQSDASAAYYWAPPTGDEDESPCKGGFKRKKGGGMVVFAHCGCHAMTDAEKKASREAGMMDFKA